MITSPSSHKTLTYPCQLSLNQSFPNWSLLVSLICLPLTDIFRLWYDLTLNWPVLSVTCPALPLTRLDPVLTPDISCPWTDLLLTANIIYPSPSLISSWPADLALTRFVLSCHQLTCPDLLVTFHSAYLSGLYLTIFTCHRTDTYLVYLVSNPLPKPCSNVHLPMTVLSIWSGLLLPGTWLSASKSNWQSSDLSFSWDLSCHWLDLTHPICLLLLIPDMSSDLSMTCSFTDSWLFSLPPFTCLALTWRGLRDLALKIYGFSQVTFKLRKMTE